MGAFDAEVITPPLVTGSAPTCIGKARHYHTTTSGSVSSGAVTGMPVKDVPADIAARVADFKRASGLTHEEIGRWAGRRVNAVSEWSLGKTKPPRSALERLAQNAQLPIQVFEDGGPMPSEEMARIGWKRPIRVSESLSFSYSSDKIEWPAELDDPEVELLFDQPGMPGWIRGLTSGPLNERDQHVAAYAVVKAALQSRVAAGAEVKPSWQRLFNALRANVPEQYR